MFRSCLKLSRFKICSPMVTKSLSGSTYVKDNLTNNCKKFERMSNWASRRKNRWLLKLNRERSLRRTIVVSSFQENLKTQYCSLALNFYNSSIESESLTKKSQLWEKSKQKLEPKNLKNARKSTRTRKSVTIENANTTNARCSVSVI
jgi:hypothetical protein